MDGCRWIKVDIDGYGWIWMDEVDRSEYRQIFVQMDGYVQVCMQIRIDDCMFICMYVCMCVCICVCMDRTMYLSVDECMYIWLVVSMTVCTYIYDCVHASIYDCMYEVNTHIFM